jgi:hypothetical protein
VAVAAVIAAQMNFIRQRAAANLSRGSRRTTNEDGQADAKRRGTKRNWGFLVLGFAVLILAVLITPDGCEQLRTAAVSKVVPYDRGNCTSTAGLDKLWSTCPGHLVGGRGRPPFVQTMQPPTDVVREFMPVCYDVPSAKLPWANVEQAANLLHTWKDSIDGGIFGAAFTGQSFDYEVSTVFIV